MTALRLWRLAAEQGEALAQSSLGVMYHEGRGVPQDYAEAIEWIQLAAEQGHAAAQYNLGVMYSRGRGVPRDDVQALMWFSLAASRHPPGKDHDRVVQDRDAVAVLMTPAQVAEAQRLAREWRPK